MSFDVIALQNAGTLIGFIGVVAISSRNRMERYRERADQLRFAKEALDRHYQALEILDDDAMPSSLLELALTFSKSLHHPLICEIILARRDRIAVLKSKARDPSPESAAAMALRANRPDLAEAFVTSIVAGAIAVSSRWPDVAFAFERILMPVEDTQVDEVQRVVRFAKRAERREPAAAIV